MRKNRLALACAFMATSLLFAQEWNPDVSRCTVALERFFFNDKESRDNLQRFYFNDKMQVVMSAFLNNDGTERSRKIFRYDEAGNLIDFSIWDRYGESWNRWEHDTWVSKQTDGAIIREEYSQYYADKPYLSGIVKTDLGGKKISEEYYSDKGQVLDSLTRYNENGDVVYEKYQTEKTDGYVIREYKIQYKDNLPESIEVIENGEPISTVVNTFNAEGKTIRMETTSQDDNSVTVEEFEYERGKLTKQRCYSKSAGKELYTLFSEYDEKGFLIKTGEIYPDYQRYWIYEFQK